MGIVRMGLPEELTLFLKERTNSNVLVETGTYYGDTTSWASNHFDKVHTIEFSEQIYQAVSAKYAHVNSITFHFGDSRELLPDILKATSNEPVIFWLDAHWSSGETYGENDNCPLIKELEIIKQSNVNACILIDDARHFLAPPPLPNNYLQFPGIQDILEVCGNDNFVAVYEDVIIIVPTVLKTIVQEYLQYRTTADWQDFGKDPDISGRHLAKILFNRLKKKFSGK